MQNHTPESMARAVVETCADCDICRYLMEDTPCTVFPELYRLYDKEMEKGEKISPEELKNLVDFCNLCGLCPCPNIHTDIMKAKSAFVSRDGLKPAIRFMEDVERVARLCGAYPQLANIVLGMKTTGGLLKKLAGIHEERKLPAFPRESFPKWVKARGLHIKRKAKGRKVAYFAGCTAKYLFPDVAKATEECIVQAKAAAARAGTVPARESIIAGGVLPWRAHYRSGHGFRNRGDMAPRAICGRQAPERNTKSSTRRGRGVYDVQDF